MCSGSFCVFFLNDDFGTMEEEKNERKILNQKSKKEINQSLVFCVCCFSVVFNVKYFNVVNVFFFWFDEQQVKVKESLLP